MTEVNDAIQVLYDLSGIGFEIKAIEETALPNYTLKLENGRITLKEVEVKRGTLAVTDTEVSTKVTTAFNSLLEQATGDGSSLAEQLPSLDASNIRTVCLLLSHELPSLEQVCDLLNRKPRSLSTASTRLGSPSPNGTPISQTFLEDDFPNAPWSSPRNFNDNSEKPPPSCRGLFLPIPKRDQTPKALEELLGLTFTGTTLGEGGYGSVFIYENDSGKEYAVKSFKRDGSQWTRLEKGEVLALLAKDHPNIVKTHALLIYNTTTDEYMVINNANQIPKESREGYQIKAVVSEVVEGEELFDALYTKRNVTFGYYTALCIGLQVSDALAYMHEKNIFFRDLKPENIMIDSSTGALKVIDFGLCKKVPKGTATSTVCGTKDYFAPEMLLRQPYDNKVDSWALGVLLSQLLLKRPLSHFLDSGKRGPTNDTQLMRNIQEFAKKSDDEKKLYLKSIEINGQKPFDSPDYDGLFDIIIALTQLDPNQRISCEEAHARLVELQPRKSQTGAAGGA